MIGVNRATCYVYLPKAVKILIGNVMICKIYFLFVLFVCIRVAFENNNKHAKKICQAYDIAAFTLLYETHDKIVYVARLVRQNREF